MEVVRLEERGIGIVQLIEQAVDRHLVELALVDRIDVEVGDTRQHVVEQPRLLVHRPLRRRVALEEPSPGRHPPPLAAPPGAGHPPPRPPPPPPPPPPRANLPGAS